MAKVSVLAATFTQPQRAFLSFFPGSRGLTLLSTCSLYLVHCSLYLVHCTVITVVNINSRCVYLTVTIICQANGRANNSHKPHLYCVYKLCILNEVINLEASLEPTDPSWDMIRRGLAGFVGSMPD